MLHQISKYRVFLVLGRISNLPTVWSNCLAGWLLGGGGQWRDFLFLCFGATLLYVAGMYLNDAFDADFDRQHRKERPVPSGQVTVATVWRMGFVMLGCGTLCLMVFGPQTRLFTILLVAAIIIYNGIHKLLTLSPVLMAGCRFLLLLVAVSAGEQGITGSGIWSATVLASYIVGLSYIARHESLKGALRYWPCVFLTAPMIYAYLINDGEYRLKASLFMALLLVWILHSLRYSYLRPQPNYGRTVSALLAGIVLVDGLSIIGDSVSITLVLAALFSSALLFQRFIPAT